MEFKNKALNFLLGMKREKDDNDSVPLGTLYKRLLQIAWPAALEGLLLSLMNSFDTMMVGKLGSAAISSVGLCAQPRMLLVLLGSSLCTGTTAVIARRRGEGKQDLAVSCLKQSLVIITGLGVLMTIIGYYLAEPMLLLCGANEDTLENAVIYFRIICYSMVPNFWNLCICAAMRGVGKTRITMVVHMISNIVNVCLNYCLIEGHFGFPALGVEGAAIATSVGSCVASFVAIVVILDKKNYLSVIPFTGFKFDKNTLSSLVKVGSGTILENVCMRIGFIINGKLVMGIATAAYATYQVVQQVTSLTFTIADGIASSCTALIGQSLGEKLKKRAMTYAKIGARVCLFLSMIIILLTFIFRNDLPLLFTDEADVILGSSISFIVILFGTYSQNMRIIFAGALRGAGDVRFVALTSLISVAIVRPLATWFFCYPMDSLFPTLMFGYIGAWISFDIDAIVRSIMLRFRVRKGQWVNIKL